MKFTKWIKSRRESGPARAMVTTVRVEFDFTPEDVAYQLLYALLYEDETMEGASPSEVREFVAGLSQKRATELVKWAVRDMGAGDYLAMYVSERFNDDTMLAAKTAVVDRFVDDEDITRLFGGAA